MAQIEQTLRTDFSHIVGSKLRFADFAELIFTSAVTGEGLGDILPAAKQAAQQYARQVDPTRLNEALQQALAAHQPPSRKNRRLRIRGIEQVTTRPPTFVLQVNDPELMHFSYKRYLINQLREAFGFGGIPLRLFVRSSPPQRES